nr:hypothetical protein [Streptomyces hawaiiensis]
MRTPWSSPGSWPPRSTGIPTIGCVADLLERWNLGLGTTLAERRMALRLSREQAALEMPRTGKAAVLPSVRRALGEDPRPAELPIAEQAAEAGDDDEGDLGPVEEDDFYADALEDV